MRSTSCSPPSAGITRDLGPHGGRGGAGLERVVTGPDPGRKSPRAGQRFRLRRGGEGPRAGAAAAPGHREGSQSTAYCSGLRRTSKGGAAARGKRAPAGRLPQASAHLKARAQVPAAGAGQRPTACRPRRAGQDRRKPEWAGDKGGSAESWAQASQEF